MHSIKKELAREAKKIAKAFGQPEISAKPVKLDVELYNEIVKIISKKDFKYRYTSISAFVNEAVYEKTKSLNEAGTKLKMAKL
ncbi:MAG: hypothetical protein HY438_02715 [DPANN group archaeon]|nr:hypothetical protein [DPANN group archaeon]